MLSVNGEKLIINHYPDGTLNIKPNPNFIEDVILIDWRFENNEEFLALAFITRYYQTKGNKITLFMPYVPNARMDRVENDGDILTMKYFGEMINNLNFERVVVLDPHSSVVSAVIKNCFILKNNLAEVINEVKLDNNLKETPLIFFPDEGAMKRYSKRLSGIPYTYGIKNRDWVTGKILDYMVIGNYSAINNIKGNDVLIIDDICSRGGTFYHAAKTLKEMGANNIYLYITHCEQSIFEGDMIKSGLIKGIYTTNSIFPIEKSNKLISVHRIELDESLIYKGYFISGGIC